MFLFVHPVTDPMVCILFDADRRIVARTEIFLRGSESERFFDSIVSFLGDSGVKISELRGIVLVNGPGGFTSMRIVTLSVNTIAFVHRIPLYAIDFFTLLDRAGASFPMLLKANRGEYLVRTAREREMELRPIDGLADGKYVGIGDENDFENRRISIQSSLDYEQCIRSLSLDCPLDRIEPIYVKRPNIGKKVS